MKIKILENSKNELKVEIIGEGHSFCNALQSLLLKDSTVEFSTYNLAHPLIAHPTLYVRTKGRRKPESAMIEAAKALGKEIEEIQATFKEALEKEEKSSSYSRT
ncbi:MAG: DNA-directed polymerase subunit [Thermoproteota archaeon]|nr:DNA-directed polymerase subunit [Thermoproteota archaeon]